MRIVALNVGIALATSLVTLPSGAAWAKSTTPVDAVETKIPESLSTSALPAKANNEATHSTHNFSRFQGMLDEVGWFVARGTVNGFSLYEEKEEKKNFISMRKCGDECCEGVIAVQPMSNEIFELYLSFLYAPLQSTLADTRENYLPKPAKDRTPALREEIMQQLKGADHAEFVFDNLNVRADCHAVPEADFKAGKRPEMIIKLWIP